MGIARPAALLLGISLLLCPSCASRRAAGSFRVLPGSPDYLLRSPEFDETPFPEVLNRYGNAGPGSVELRPLMELRIENAYYRGGAPGRSIADYLGSEVARYQVDRHGRLRLRAVESALARRPEGQPAVQHLISPSQLRHRHHRFFWQVAFSEKAGAQQAVLLGADFQGELDQLTRRLLAAPSSVCGDDSVPCTVFPKSCTVSLEIAIRVNGTLRTVLWGRPLAMIAPSASQVELLRLHSGRHHPVELDPDDPESLRLPLLPGDRISWR